MAAELGRVEQVLLLDGALDAWRAPGLPTASGEPETPAPGDIVLSPGQLPGLDPDAAAAMPVEFISAVHPNPATEGDPTAGTGIDVDYARRQARALDDGGVDYTLVTYHSAAPDALQLAQFGANHTERIKTFLAHRPGVIFPTSSPSRSS